MYKLFLTFRYLTRKKIVVFPVLVVWLCVMMLIIVTSIMGGFVDRVRDANRDLFGDIIVSGDGGYAAGSEPDAVLHAVKVLAAFYTMRPASLIADVAITPAGGVVTYSQLPGEVQTFIAQWSIGEQWAAVG